MDCGFLARLVAEHRLEEDEAHEVARALAYDLVKAAYSCEAPLRTRRLPRCRPMSTVRAMIGGRSNPASSISASAPSTARTRRSCSTMRSPAATCAGAITGASLRSPAVRDSLRRRTGSIRSSFATGRRSGAGDRRGARNAGRAGMSGDAGRGLGAADDPDRDAHDHREGLSAEARRSRSAAPRPKRARVSGRRIGATSDAGIAPFTAISCDNLPDNGRRLEAAVLAIAQRRDPALADWIADARAFPRDDGRPHRPGHRPGGHRRAGRTDRPRRPGDGQDRALPPMGDRGSLSRPTAGFRSGGRAADRSRRALGGGQASAAQRRAFRHSPISAASPGSPCSRRDRAPPAARASSRR